ncbi:MAG: DUF2752 domain-containing protein [Clostridia bacterium]|nr:DUF2752 domain-containing protein [Clostridia bacterium]
MTFSRKEQWIIFGLINGLLISAIALFPLYDKYLVGVPFNRCAMLDYLHLYCPACGGTRAFSALISFDILSSLKYNPIVFAGAVLFVIYEIAMIKHLVRGKDRGLLLKPWMVFVFIGIWFSYAIIRNVLLFYGIDLIGNVIH